MTRARVGVARRVGRHLLELGERLVAAAGLVVDQADEVLHLGLIAAVVAVAAVAARDRLEARDRVVVAAGLVVEEAEAELRAGELGVLAHELLEVLGRGGAVVGLFVDLRHAHQRGRIARRDLELLVQHRELALGVLLLALQPRQRVEERRLVGLDLQPRR